MQIVIDIPKEFESHFELDRFSDSLGRIENDVKNSGALGRYERETITMIRKAIENGTPLPKGHGRLIDEDAIKKYVEDGAICHKCVGNGWGCQDDCTFPDYVDYKMEKMLKEQETVVEADEEGEKDGNNRND